MNKTLLLALLTSLSLSTNAWAVQTRSAPKDQYVDRSQFLEDAIYFCKKVTSGAWPIQREGSLTAEQLKFVSKMTASTIDDVKIYSGLNDLGIGSLTVSLKNQTNKAYALTAYSDGEVYNISLDHLDMVAEGIVRVILDIHCGLKKATFSYYNAREAIYLRHWINERHEIYRTLVTKEEIKNVEKLTHKTASEISKGQDQFKVLVGIIDQGVDYNHPRLAEKMRPIQKRLATLNQMNQEQNQIELGTLDRWILSRNNPEWLKTFEANQARLRKNISDRSKDERTIGLDFVANDTLPYDYASSVNMENTNDTTDAKNFDHGTHVADIASRDAAIRLLPLRVANDSVKAGTAVDYAAQRGVRVINLSMGSFNAQEWEPFHQAMRRHRDILFVVAAGNEAQNIDQNPTFPAAFSEPNMVVVASIDPDGKISSFSNYGPKHTHIAALGRDVLAATPHNTEGTKSGTSMATPQVTRVAARMLALNPDLKPTEIIQILMQTSIKTPASADKVRSGVLSEEAALRAVRK